MILSHVNCKYILGTCYKLKFPDNSKNSDFGFWTSESGFQILNTRIQNLNETIIRVISYEEINIYPNNSRSNPNI